MFIASLALSAAVATAPAQAAYTGIEPVRVAVVRTRARRSRAIDLPYGLFNRAQRVIETAISFVNDRLRPLIASVTFDVTDGRTKQPDRRQGTFSNGVAIEPSRFVTPEFGNALSDVTCTVKSVAFADGSIWQAQ